MALIEVAFAFWIMNCVSALVLSQWLGFLWAVGIVAACWFAITCSLAAVIVIEEQWVRKASVTERILAIIKGTGYAAMCLSMVLAFPLYMVVRMAYERFSRRFRSTTA